MFELVFSVFLGLLLRTNKFLSWEELMIVKFTLFHLLFKHILFILKIGIQPKVKEFEGRQSHNPFAEPIYSQVFFCSI
jgi:hypothetical protein